MADIPGRKTFKVFNQEFVVDERYNVTKELGQGAYGIVWYDSTASMKPSRLPLRFSCCALTNTF
jgi:mitogen-activated protein kinase 7